MKILRSLLFTLFHSEKIKVAKHLFAPIIKRLLPSVAKQIYYEQIYMSTVTLMTDIKKK